jgi:hypothetical protein
LFNAVKTVLEPGKGIRADFQDRFGSEISGLKILQDRIGSDPSLKKCDRIGSVRKPDLKSQDRIGSVLGRDRFGPARIFTMLEYILKIELINSALT